MESTASWSTPMRREPRGDVGDRRLQLRQVVLDEPAELDAGEHQHGDQREQDQVDDDDDDRRGGRAVPAPALQRVPDGVHDDDEHRRQEQGREHVPGGVQPGEHHDRGGEEQERAGGGRESLGRGHPAHVLLRRGFRARKIARASAAERQSRGVVPYVSRNARPKCEASANPHRAPTAPAVRCADAGSRRSRRHCSRRWSADRGLQRDPGAGERRVQVADRHVVRGGDRARPTGPGRRGASGRTPGRGAPARVRERRARVVFVGASQGDERAEQVDARARHDHVRGVRPIEDVGASQPVEERRDHGRERVVVRADPQTGDGVDRRLRQGEGAAGDLEVVQLGAVGVAAPCTGACCRRPPCRPPGARPGSLLAPPSSCPRPGRRGTPSARGPAGRARGSGGASRASTGRTTDSPGRASATRQSTSICGPGRSYSISTGSTPAQMASRMSSMRSSGGRSSERRTRLMTER